MDQPKRGQSHEVSPFAYIWGELEEETPKKKMENPFVANRAGYTNYSYYTPQSKAYQDWKNNEVWMLEDPRRIDIWAATKFLNAKRARQIGEEPRSVDKTGEEYYQRIESKVYKIHLQVKPQYFEEVIHILDHAIKNNDIESWHFKHAIDPERAKREERAMFVIYIFSGPDAMKKSLTYLIQRFKGQTQRLGTGVCLRYNHKVNNLIFYTQGNTDTKDHFLNHPNEHLLFDDTPIKHNRFSQHIELEGISDCVPARIQTGKGDEDGVIWIYWSEEDVESERVGWYEAKRAAKGGYRYTKLWYPGQGPLYKGNIRHDSPDKGYWHDEKKFPLQEYMYNRPLPAGKKEPKTGNFYFSDSIEYLQSLGRLSVKH
jgi:hypothetical protein